MSQFFCDEREIPRELGIKAPETLIEWTEFLTDGDIQSKDGSCYVIIEVKNEIGLRAPSLTPRDYYYYIYVLN